MGIPSATCNCEGSLSTVKHTNDSSLEKDYTKCCPLLLPAITIAQLLEILSTNIWILPKCRTNCGFAPLKSWTTSDPPLTIKKFSNCTNLVTRQGFFTNIRSTWNQDSKSLKMPESNSCIMN